MAVGGSFSKKKTAHRMMDGPVVDDINMPFKR